MKRLVLALLLAGACALSLDYGAWLTLRWLGSHEWAANVRLESLGRCYVWNYRLSGFRAGCYR